MHHAPRIQEILLNIFGHCCPTSPHWGPDRRRFTATLAALARTCRVFKESALDVLWTELVDLTPLPRCIPEACCLTGRRVRTKFVPVKSSWMFNHILCRSIRSNDHPMRRSGISFEATLVASGTYLATPILMGGSIMTA